MSFILLGQNVYSLLVYVRQNKMCTENPGSFAAVRCTIEKMSELR